MKETRPTTDIERFVEVGTDAAVKAGGILMEHFGTEISIFNKGEIDLVTEVDHKAEALILSRIRKAFPEHAIVSEESLPEAERGAFTWIIDPLDGTTNYAHGFPVFCVSIGLEIDRELAWGIVYNPVLDEVFIAQRDRGAKLNGKAIHVSSSNQLGESLLATGFPYDLRESEDNNLDHFRDFAYRSRAIRRAGSAALDLCYVAAGRFDGFWELKLRPWDCAAGYLMVREAGGTVTNFRGERGSVYDRQSVASNGRIHQEMLSVLVPGPA